MIAEHVGGLQGNELAADPPAVQTEGGGVAFASHLVKHQLFDGVGIEDAPDFDRAGRVQPPDPALGLVEGAEGPFERADDHVGAVGEGVADSALDPHEHDPGVPGLELVGLVGMVAGGGVDAGEVHLGLAQAAGDLVGLADPAGSDQHLLPFLQTLLDELEDGHQLGVEIGAERTIRPQVVVAGGRIGAEVAQVAVTREGVFGRLAQGLLVEFPLRGAHGDAHVDGLAAHQPGVALFLGDKDEQRTQQLEQAGRLGDDGGQFGGGAGGLALIEQPGAFGGVGFPSQVLALIAGELMRSVGPDDIAAAAVPVLHRQPAHDSEDIADVVGKGRGAEGVAIGGAEAQQRLAPLGGGVAADQVGLVEQHHVPDIPAEGHEGGLDNAVNAVPVVIAHAVQIVRGGVDVEGQFVALTKVRHAGLAADVLLGPVEEEGFRVGNEDTLGQFPPPFTGEAIEVFPAVQFVDGVTGGEVADFIKPLGGVVVRALDGALGRDKQHPFSSLEQDEGNGHEGLAHPDIPGEKGTVPGGVAGDVVLLTGVVLEVGEDLVGVQQGKETGVFGGVDLGHGSDHRLLKEIPELILGNVVGGGGSVAEEAHLVATIVHQRDETVGALQRAAVRLFLPVAVLVEERFLTSEAPLEDIVSGLQAITCALGEADPAAARRDVIDIPDRFQGFLLVGRRRSARSRSAA